MAWFFEKRKEISREQIMQLVAQSAQEGMKRICDNPKKVLLLPPDITRMHSGSGWITEEFYKIFSKSAEVYVMPTLGQTTYPPYGSPKQTDVRKYSRRKNSET
ncbi:hypothetical protein [Marispirochaeta sp.]|uniref:hypothetical protein n=1 Tax=Marispirochaeta sp. TaxID=2038653 RepID=UPI0029C68079|nr:hypothetical protein [Marispirochaeta sp.]